MHALAQYDCSVLPIINSGLVLGDYGHQMAIEVNDIRQSLRGKCCVFTDAIPKLEIP